MNQFCLNFNGRRFPIVAEHCPRFVVGSFLQISLANSPLSAEQPCTAFPFKNSELQLEIRMGGISFPLCVLNKFARRLLLCCISKRKRKISYVLRVYSYLGG